MENRYRDLRKYKRINGTLAYKMEWTYIPPLDNLRPKGEGKKTLKNTKDTPTPTSIVLNGSGGDYLSNEIFYRIARCREKRSSTVKIGHLHIANSNPVFNYDHKNQLYSAFTMVESISEMIKIIKRCINSI